jgi:hypothetical protein
LRRSGEEGPCPWITRTASPPRHLGSANQIFAEGFLIRHPTRTTTIDDGQQLRIWFDEPRLTLGALASPASTRAASSVRSE